MFLSSPSAWVPFGLPLSRAQKVLEECVISRHRWSNLTYFRANSVLAGTGAYGCAARREWLPGGASTLYRVG
jgi:hypothetical protein